MEWITNINHEKEVEEGTEREMNTGKKRRKVKERVEREEVEKC